MPEYIYQLEDVTKIYGKRKVCHIEYLEIRGGEILIIMGPNGAGKSTLLRLLNFLEFPTSGTIKFQGHQFNGNGEVPLEIRRQVTTVFQEPILLSGNVETNVAYGLKLRHQGDIRSRVGEALEKVQLLSLAKARVSTLSGGEAQRVALARALVFKPDVLLLDEPTANLDPYNVNLIEDLIRSINRELGTTIILVTHNLFQAKRLAHRIAFLLEGKLIETGETERVFSRPLNHYTAAFIKGEIIY